MKIPQFLYVPKINTKGSEKLVIETRINAYWQVLEFETETERAKWYDENEKKLPEVANTVTFHKKYPFVLLNLGVKSKTTTERVVKLGEMASDWYAQFWLRNKKLSKPIFGPEDNNLEKAKKYFKHWVWGDNDLTGNEHSYLINLEHGVSLKFPYGETFFADFEDFETSLADVQFLSGNRPGPEEVEELIIDAWNFLGISERLGDGYGIEDINDEIF